MMTGAIPSTAYAPSRVVKQRLSLSFAASLCVHAVAVAILVGLFESLPTPLSRLGSAPSIQVALVGQPSIRFAPPPEAPPLAAEVPLAPRPVEQVPLSPPVQWRSSTPSPKDQSPSAEPHGGSVQSDATAAEVPAGAVLPPGSTSVGVLQSTDRIGRAQELRLAQRFPIPAINPVRLSEPLVVPYPPRAAAEHREARIAVLLILDADGRIVETNLFPDDPLFRPTVLDVLSRTQLVPARLDGKPVPYWAILEFVFTLRHTTTPPPAPRPG